MRAHLALAGIAALAVYACSSAPTPDEATNVQPDAESPAEASVEAGQAIPDATPPVEDDAGAEAGPCVAPDASTDPAGDRCYPAGDCPTCAEGQQYRCAEGQPVTSTGSRLDCLKLGDMNGHVAFCCPSACVRSKAHDSRCGGDGGTHQLAFACPLDSSGNSIVPPSNCITQHTGPDPSPANPFTVSCCQ